MRVREGILKFNENKGRGQMGNYLVAATKSGARIAFILFSGRTCLKH